MLDAGHSMQAVTGEKTNNSRQALEVEMDGRLHGTTTANTIHASLAATEGASNLTKTRCGTAVIARRLTELWGVAQLEGLNAGDHRCFTE